MTTDRLRHVRGRSVDGQASPTISHAEGGVARNCMGRMGLSAAGAAHGHRRRVDCPRESAVESVYRVYPLPQWGEGRVRGTTRPITPLLRQNSIGMSQRRVGGSTMMSG